MRRHHISFKYALQGVIYNVKTQPNFRIHLIAATIAILFGIYFKIARHEWTILVLTIFCVLMAEMINTALESITDMVTTKKNRYAKIAKDTAAGMVLMAAIGSIVVGFAIFLPYISKLLRL